MSKAEEYKAVLIMFVSALIVTILSVSGCTVSIIQTDTHGTASDVVDAEQTTDNSPEFEADVDVPVSATSLPPVSSII